MLAGKFLAIVDKVRQSLALDGAAEARFIGCVEDGGNQHHTIKAIESVFGTLEVRLDPVSASCKARNRTEAEAVCCSSDECCGKKESIDSTDSDLLSRVPTSKRPDLESSLAAPRDALSITVKATLVSGKHPHE